MPQLILDKYQWINAVGMGVLKAVQCMRRVGMTQHVGVYSYSDRSTRRANDATKPLACRRVGIAILIEEEGSL